MRLINIRNPLPPLSSERRTILRRPAADSLCSARPPPNPQQYILDTVPGPQALRPPHLPMVLLRMSYPPSVPHRKLHPPGARALDVYPRSLPPRKVEKSILSTQAPYFKTNFGRANGSNGAGRSRSSSLHDLHRLLVSCTWRAFGTKESFVDVIEEITGIISATLTGFRQRGHGRIGSRRREKTEHTH